VQRFLALDEEDLRRQPELARAAAAELGAHDADVLCRAIEVLGVPPAGADALDVLAGHVAALADADEPFERRLAELMRAHGATDVRALLEQLATGGGLGDLVEKLVARSPDGGALRMHVVELVAGSPGASWPS
jgi:hypothetical protein